MQEGFYMAASTLLFIFIGAGVVTERVMRFVLWLDDPNGQSTARRAHAH